LRLIFSFRAKVEGNRPCRALKKAQELIQRKESRRLSVLSFNMRERAISVLSHL
jgi:hypothetical protein